METTEGNPKLALVEAFHRLDDLFLHSSEPTQVKAYVGASGTWVFLDLESLTCTIASHGAGLAVQGTVQGGLNARCFEGRLLLPVSKESLRDEERLRATFPGCGSCWEEASALPLLKGLSPVARAFGLGVLKDEHLAAWHSRKSGSARALHPPPSRGAQYVVSEPHISTVELEPSGEPIVVGSGGLWQHLSPTAAAALCSAEWEPAGEASPAPGEPPSGDGDQAGAGPGGGPDAASVLVLRALSAAAAARLPRPPGGRSPPPSVEDLWAVPCAEHSPPPGSGSGGKAQKKAARSEQQTRAALHGDVTAVVISWQNPEGPLDADEIAVGIGRRRRQPFSRSAESAAARRWALVANLYRCSICLRRSLLRKWLQVAEEALSTSRQKRIAEAREAEVAAWKAEGRAIRILDDGTASPLSIDVHSRTQLKPF